MFHQCYGRLLLLGLCLSLPPACLNTAASLFTTNIQPVGNHKAWLKGILLPWFRNLLFQPETLMLVVASCLSFIILDIFVLKVFSVGIRRYILMCKNGVAEPIMDTLFWGFNCKSYKNIVKTMFLRDLYVAGWSLLFLIPGIVKSLEYLAVPWILARRPEKPSAKIFRHGKLLMKKRKADAFFTLFLCSLMFWELLNTTVSALVFSAPAAGAVFPAIMSQATGVLFVFPYRLLTEGEFFLLIKNPQKLKEVLKEKEGECADDNEDMPPGLFWKKEKERQP